MTGYAIVSTTVADEAAARALAVTLVEARLVACVQIMPVESVYRWQGQVETAREHLLLCKIREADFAAVESTISVNHAYDVPEIVLTKIVAGASPYLAWLGTSTERRSP